MHEIIESFEERLASNQGPDALLIALKVKFLWRIIKVLEQELLN